MIFIYLVVWQVLRSVQNKRVILRTCLARELLDGDGRHKTRCFLNASVILLSIHSFKETNAAFLLFYTLYGEVV